MSAPYHMVEYPGVLGDNNIGAGIYCMERVARDFLHCSNDFLSGRLIMLIESYYYRDIFFMR